MARQGLPHGAPSGSTTTAPSASLQLAVSTHRSAPHGSSARSRGSRKLPIVSSLRLRTAYGFSGQHPGSSKRRRIYNAVPVTSPRMARPADELGQHWQQRPQAGAVERVRGRLRCSGSGMIALNFQATGYSKARPGRARPCQPAPSVGGVTTPVWRPETSTRFDNLGQMDNRGIEELLTANLIQSPQHPVRFHGQLVDTTTTRSSRWAPGRADSARSLDGQRASSFRCRRRDTRWRAWFQRFSYTTPSTNGIVVPGDCDSRCEFDVPGQSLP